MRGLALFVAGTLVGLAATSAAQNQGPNRGVVGINHVALAVPDIDKAVEVTTHAAWTGRAPAAWAAGSARASRMAVRALRPLRRPVSTIEQRAA